MTKADLEKDLLAVQYIHNKCRNNDVYAQNLYAALCNNRFFKNQEEWTCSWRYAGGIVADLRNLDEDYMHFYCSGIGTGHIAGYVSEGFVTSEIRNDLLNLGWTVEPYEPRLEPGTYRNDWGDYDAGK
jgi:hypothetical protein